MALPTQNALTPSIQVAGFSNILIAFPGNLNVCHRVGEQLDETQFQLRKYIHDVPGDSNGGPQGPPIEQQLLGQVYICEFNLSKFHPIIKQKLIEHAAAAEVGKFSMAEVGSLLHKDRSFRIVISPSKSNTIPTNDPTTGDAHPYAGDNYDYYNFPCCTITDPVSWGQGTKFSALRFTAIAYRVPEGHALAPGSAGVDWAKGLFWDKSTTGVPNALLPPDMQS